MKKLRLRLDELRVDSFTVSEGGGEKGTVEGYVSLRCTGGLRTCDGAHTCGGVGETCEPTMCDISCNGSCPCYPDDPYTDYQCGGINSAADTCSPCQRSVNNVNTCVSPCTYTCP